MTDTPPDADVYVGHPDDGAGGIVPSPAGAGRFDETARAAPAPAPYIPHVHVFVNNVRRECETAEGLTVSGGRSSRLDGAPDAAVAGLSLRVLPADVPKLGDMVRIDMIEPTTDPAVVNLRYGIPLFRGVITDISVAFRADLYITVSINAVDALRIVDQVHMAKHTGPPSNDHNRRVRDIIDADIVPKLSSLPVTHAAPPGTGELNTVIGASAPFDSQSLLARWRFLLAHGGYTMYATPIQSALASGNFSSITAYRNYSSDGGQRYGDYGIAYVDDLKGTPFGSDHAHIPCDVIAFEPPPTASVSGTSYANYYNVGYGTTTQHETFSFAPTTAHAPNVNRKIPTFLETLADAAALSDTWAHTTGYVQPVYTATILGLAPITEPMGAAAGRAAQREIIKACVQGCGQVARPIKLDLDGIPGSAHLFYIEATKVTWHPDGWLIDLTLSPDDAYTIHHPYQGQWPPTLGFAGQHMPDPAQVAPTNPTGGVVQVAPNLPTGGTGTGGTGTGGGPFVLPGGPASVLTGNTWHVVGHNLFDYNAVKGTRGGVAVDLAAGEPMLLGSMTSSTGADLTAFLNDYHGIRADLAAHGLRITASSGWTATYPAGAFDYAWNPGGLDDTAWTIKHKRNAASATVTGSVPPVGATLTLRLI